MYKFTKEEYGEIELPLPEWNIYQFESDVHRYWVYKPRVSVVGHIRNELYEYATNQIRLDGIVFQRRFNDSQCSTNYVAEGRLCTSWLPKPELEGRMFAKMLDQSRNGMGDAKPFEPYFKKLDEFLNGDDDGTKNGRKT